MATKSRGDYPSECKPNINDLRQLFDSSRYDYKRNFGIPPPSGPPPSLGSAAYSDAKQSSMDENVFESSKIGHVVGGRNFDFERAKQKFDKPTSLRLSNKAMATKQMLGNFMKMGQSCGPSSGIVPVSAKPRNDSGVTGGGGGKKDKYNNMNSSLNLDELKVSDDDDVSKLECVAIL